MSINNGLSSNLYLDNYVLGFSPTCTLTMPSVYQLHLDKASAFIERLGESTSKDLKTFLQDAIKGEAQLQELICKKNYTLINTLTAILEKLEPNDERRKIYEETLGKINTSIQNSLTSCRKKIDANQGMDVTLIKQLVNQILGLEEIGSRFKPMLENLTQQDRNQYFQWMKESQFLESSFSNLNEIRYDPGHIIQLLLKKYSQIDIILLGCGKNSVCFPSDCNDRKNLAVQHNEKALAIDIDSSTEPHVLADIFNESFWEKIPDQRITCVSNHMNGTYILNESEAKVKTILSHIYRVLKFGGCLQCHFEINNAQENLLKMAGFSVDNSNGIAYKKEILSST